MRSIFLFILISLWCSCGTTIKVKNGAEAFQYKKYALAIRLLEEELNQKESPQSRLLLAESYDAIGEYSKAAAHYAKAVDETEDLNAWLSYAFILKKNQRYDEALEIFKFLKTESQLDYLLDREIQACEKSLDWIARPDSNLTIEPLRMNSIYSDYAPSYIDGQLIFTSDRVENEKGGVYDWTGLGYSDFWVSSDEGRYASLWNAGFNTRDNEGAVVLYPNGKEIYFTRCAEASGGDVFCQLYWSKREQVGAWEKAAIVENLNGPFNVKHACFSGDGNIMFYSSDAPTGKGGYDIYYSRRTPEGGWTAGLLLPEMINSEEDEVFPAVWGDTLYFSSNGHPGMGGLDMFKSYFNKNDQWVRPINLGGGMNSGADDFGLWLDTLTHPQVKQQGYFSSNRPGGMGRDDIYSFKRLLPREEKEEKTPDDFLVTIKVLSPVYLEEGDPKSGLEKYVPLEGAQIQKEDQEITVDITGLYSTPIDSAYQAKWEVVKPGYFPSTVEVDMTQSKNNKLFLRVIMEPIIYNQDYSVNNIYYDFNRWEIREDARPPLDSLAALIKGLDDVGIQLISHTDCRGEESFNLDLSQKRAESAVQYLISKGVVAEMITPLGRGEQDSAIDCACEQCTEEEHQANRRTVFRIIKN